MPELPEVQTVINYLKRNIIDKKIVAIEIKLPKLIKNVSTHIFIKNLIDSKFNDILRCGKYLLFIMNNKKIIVSHLRMEGKFFYETKPDSNNKHNHIIFHLNDKHFLIYNDTRQFGTFHLYDSIEEAMLSKQLAKLGPEPFDEQFNSQYLYDLTRKSNKNIKTFLLDQTNVVGIGNIYVNEILFASQIHPVTVSKNLSLNDIDKIIYNTTKILKKSIEYNGTTIHSFKFNKWNTGDYQQFLVVHSRKNETCLVCKKNKIEKITVNGRGTYLCSYCQRISKC